MKKIIGSGIGHHGYLWADQNLQDGGHVVMTEDLVLFYEKKYVEREWVLNHNLAPSIFLPSFYIFLFSKVLDSSWPIHSFKKNKFIISDNLQNIIYVHTHSSSERSYLNKREQRTTLPMPKSFHLQGRLRDRMSFQFHLNSTWLFWWPHNPCDVTCLPCSRYR